MQALGVNLSMPETQSADSKARRNFIVGLLFLFVAALVVRPIFGGLEQWVTEDPETIREKVPIVVSGIAVAFIPLLLFGVIIWRMGNSVIASGRFPSPTMKVIVDTPIIEGRIALIRGRLLQLTGILMCVVAIGFPLFFWWIVTGIIRDA